MNKNIKILIAALVIAAVYVWIDPPNATTTPTVNNKEVKEAGTFDECVKEGNPIQESYPPTCRTKSGKLITQNIGNGSILKDTIRVESPRPGTRVTNPLDINGQARGAWFFEAQFSGKMLNEDGEVIGEGIMSATDEWMTDEFVPFTGEIMFDPVGSKRGRLIFEKNNPSGLPENIETLIVPVVFE